MADLKISQLTSASIPLAGTEVVPLVQSGTTKKVAVSDFTTGRAVSALSLALTGTPLPVTSGGTGLASWTANGIPYASATTTLTSSTAMTYDGTNWLLGALNTGNNYQVTTGGVYSSQSVSPSLMRSAAMVTNNNSGLIGWDFTAIDVVNKTALPSTGSVIGTMFSMNANTLDVSVPSGNLVIGTSSKGIDFSGGVLWRTGTGSPENVVTASVGSMYTNVAGGAGTTLYVKESGSGSTGWIAK